MEFAVTAAQGDLKDLKENIKHRQISRSIPIVNHTHRGLTITLRRTDGPLLNFRVEIDQIMFRLSSFLLNMPTT